MMAAIQLAAARLAGVHEFLYYAFDAQGAADVREGCALLSRCWTPEGTHRDLVHRLAEAQVPFGVSDGT